jgi:hypothetical protein
MQSQEGKLSMLKTIRETYQGEGVSPPHENKSSPFAVPWLLEGTPFPPTWSNTLQFTVSHLFQLTSSIFLATVQVKNLLAPLNLSNETTYLVSGGLAGA